MKPMDWHYGDPMIRGLMLAAIALIFVPVAHAADLDGISLPETQWADGKQVRLNGHRPTHVLGCLVIGTDVFVGVVPNLSFARMRS